MSRKHYEKCLRNGVDGSDGYECDCYEFDRALAWVSPYLIAQIREGVLDMQGISLMGQGYFLKGNEVLDLLDAKEKELG